MHTVGAKNKKTTTTTTTKVEIRTALVFYNSLCNIERSRLTKEKLQLETEYCERHIDNP